ncbi:hypothetical protein EVA_15087 [gut metagenome]|uniref:DUF3575 domain-containing protein n=1 Tax=gut metagenome TaxID=749906 RepID=J9G4R0_9ZZZZ
MQRLLKKDSFDDPIYSPIFNVYMKRMPMCLAVLLCLLYLPVSTIQGQKIAVKTNLLYDVTGTFNFGIEASLASQWSVDLSANYNAWNFPHNRKWKHLLIQPEVRYWLCERSNGHFIGLHAHWNKFNIAHVKMPFGLWKETRYRRFEGDLWGGGLSYGYDWLLSRHWNLEAIIGIGYARVSYKKYPCASCGRVLDQGKKNYFGPTKAAVNLVYLF